MSSSDHYDVIIIGTGAGGGTLAHHLAPSGKRILMIERGDYLPREKQNWSSKDVFVQGRYLADEHWKDGDGNTFQPGIHYFVGGNTKFYGAALLRLRPEDFGELKQVDGLSPAWPLGYDDFEPYYSQAEHLYRVHGRHGEDPTEGHWSQQYPHPPVSHEPRIQELCDDLEKLGHKPFHLAVGVDLDEADRPHSPCIRCETCDGFPCLVHAKSDAEVICVEPALCHPGVELLTRALAKRLTTSASGREVTGVVVERDGVEQTYSADLVVVACGAINSALLLLRSANDKHPDGLANGSGVVGRHYMFHNSSAVMAVSLTPNPTRFQKTLNLNDFYFGSHDWDHPLGNIQMVGKSDAEMISGEAPVRGPRKAFEEMATHAIDFWLTTEDLPLWDNRVTLARDGQVRIHYKHTNAEAHRRLVAKLESMLTKIGCAEGLTHRSLYLHKSMPLAATAHQAGTIRFGPDPSSSALDLFCRAHELDNLYVVDSSFFPSIGGQNPSLTIMANALRVGDHLLERLGARAQAREVV